MYDLIGFDTDDDVLRKALFEKYRIRNCSVRLNRLVNGDIPKRYPNTKYQLVPKKGTLRSNVGWLPTPSAKPMKREALSAFAAYQEKNDVVPRIAAKNLRRERTKSMFAERSNLIQQSNKADKKYTMDEMHLELRTKIASPNRGLVSAHDRILPEPKQRPQLSSWEKLQIEFKDKVEAKMSNVRAEK